MSVEFSILLQNRLLNDPVNQKASDHVNCPLHCQCARAKPSFSGVSVQSRSLAMQESISTSPKGRSRSPRKAPKKLLRDVPAAWDDVRLIDGEPGQFVVIARRKGDQWFVGGINGQNRVKRVGVSLSFLEEQPYGMTLIADGTDKETFATTVGRKTADDRLEVEMSPYGGFVTHLVPQAESR